MKDLNNKVPTFVNRTMHSVNVAALVSLFLSIVFIHILNKQFERTLPIECNKVLDAVFAYNGKDVHSYLKCMGDVGRAMYMDFYLFDLILFPLIYSTAWYGILVQISPAWVSIAPFLMAIVDVFENVCMYYLLSTFPVNNDTLATVVSFLSFTKWTLSICALIATIGGVIKWLQGSSKEGELNKKK